MSTQQDQKATNNLLAGAVPAPVVQKQSSTPSVLLALLLISNIAIIVLISLLLSRAWTMTNILSNAYNSEYEEFVVRLGGGYVSASIVNTVTVTAR